jgi:phi13 family phage major tail protein
MPKIYEYRGVAGLVAAPVLEDSTENFTTGPVIELAGVSQISKETDSTNEAHYYDNIAAVVISSTGADTLTINTSAIPLDVLAKITGQTYDAAKGLFVERERTPGYWALGYKTKTTDGVDMYVWRQKGTFNMPGQTNATENDGTDANGQEITYTGVGTVHKYTLDGKLTSINAVTVDTSINPVNETVFFASVQTPDTIAGAPEVTGIGVSPASVSVAEGAKVQLTATLYPAGATGTIVWSSSASGTASVDADTGEVTGVAAGSATITATCGTFTDTCAVTVTE